MSCDGTFSLYELRGAIDWLRGVSVDGAELKMIDEQEPGFNPNTNPTDCDGRPLEPGDYEVRRGGQVQLATVFEDDACELLVRFAGSERTQRVDECAKHVSWSRITPSEQTA